MTPTQESKTMKLNREETKMIAALRNLRATEVKPRVVPAALLEWGEVSQRRAAELLGVNLKEISRLHHEGSGGYVGHRLPFVNEGRVPMSELRRQWERRERMHLVKLAQQLLDGVKTTAWSWYAIEPAFPHRIYEGPAGIRGFGVAGVAKRLRVSQAEVRRLIAGPLFAWDLRGGQVITFEELEAFERAKSKDPTVGSSVAGGAKGRKAA